jgi:hypothetical protein
MPPFSFLLVEAARGQPVSVREEEEGGRLGRAGGLGRPGGRGPVGEGRENRQVKKKRLGRKAGWAESDGENSFSNKIWFLNIPRLWKFAQGDLGGILIWGFSLNSSRLLKDFRKIKYAMQCILYKILFLESFSYVL